MIGCPSVIVMNLFILELEVHGMLAGTADKRQTLGFVGTVLNSCRQGDSHTPLNGVKRCGKVRFLSLVPLLK